MQVYSKLHDLLAGHSTFEVGMFQIGLKLATGQGVGAMHDFLALIQGTVPPAAQEEIKRLIDLLNSKGLHPTAPTIQPAPAAPMAEPAAPAAG